MAIKCIGKAAAKWIPATSKKAKALRLVTLKQMLHSLRYAIENPPATGINIMELEDIRKT